MDYNDDTPSPDQLSDETPSPHRGRARERVRRRQERQTAEIPAIPSLPQLRPSGGFRMPELPALPLRLLLPLGGAALIAIGILVVLSRVTGNTEPPTPPNALWLGTEWTYALDEDASVPDLVVRLREHHIGNVYAWVSWLKDDLQWAGKRDENNEFTNFETVEQTVRDFVTEFNTLYPEANLYAWISLPVGTDGRDMSDPLVQQMVAQFSQRAIEEFEFDGVFLNIEPVWNNDTSFLQLLSVVRETLGEDVMISTAIPPDWSPPNPTIPVPPLIAPGTAWDERYKQSVALLADELAIMAYNSGLSNPTDYSQWVAYQVKTYADAVAALDTGTGQVTQVMVGIPTYAAEPPGHDPLVENIPTALQGVRLGLQQAGENAEYVGGVAIYADWETDETEWAQFMVNWIETPVQ